jgi:hypothetical protein
MGTDEVAVLYGGVEALPTTFMIDREGRIAAVHVGLVSKSDYESDLDALISDAPPTNAASIGGIPAAGSGAN